MNELNLNTYKKRYLSLILNDEKQTKVFITSPTNELRHRLLDYVRQLDQFKGYSNLELNETEIVDDLYELCTELINRNKNGIIFEKKQIENMLDYEDINVFLAEYMRYLLGFYTEKN